MATPRGVFSSRKLERATYDSVAFRFIAANDHPGHDTIANFRRRFLKPNFHTWHLAQSGNPRNTARFAKPYNIVVLNREMFWPKIWL